jgi:hypothetical protein
VIEALRKSSLDLSVPKEMRAEAARQMRNQMAILKRQAEAD